MKNNKPSYLKKLFPDKHYFSLFVLILLCFLIFGYFGVFKFSSFISERIDTSFIKGDIYSGFQLTSGDLNIDIVTPEGNQVVIEGESGDFYFDLPVGYETHDLEGKTIDNIKIEFDTLPDYITDVAIQTTIGSCGVGCAPPVSNGAVTTEVGSLNLSADNSNGDIFNIRFTVPDDDVQNFTFNLEKIYIQIQSAPPPQIAELQFGNVVTVYAAAAPATPTGLQASNITHESFDLNWNAPANADHYEVWLDGEAHETTTTTNYSFTELTPSTTYIAHVEAFNEYDMSNGDPASLDIDTTASFSITDVDLTGEGLSNTEFYGRAGNEITATVNLSTAVSGLDYTYTWNCQTGEPGTTCPNPNPTVNASNASSDTITIGFDSHEGTTWQLDVLVANTATGETADFTIPFLLVDAPPVITLLDVQTTTVIPTGINQATTLDELFYIEEDKTSTIRLSVQDDDDVQIGSASQPFDDTTIVDASINGNGDVVSITITEPSNADATINQEGDIINSLDPKVISLSINGVNISLDVHVVNQNDEPSFTNTDNIVYTVGGSTQTKYLQGDDIDVGDLLTFSIDGNNPLENLGFNVVDSSTGELGFGAGHPSYGDAGENNVTFKVEDQYGGFTTEIITIVIDETNRSPEINWGYPTTFTKDEDEVIEIDLSTQASDPDEDDLTWSIMGNSTLNALATYEVTNNIAVFTPFENKNGGPVTAILQVEDDGGASDTQQISLTWNAVNDAPEITATTKQAFRTQLQNASMSFSTNEGNDIVFDFVTAFGTNIGLNTLFTDVDTGDSFHWEISEVDSNIVGTISESGTDESLWTVTPADYTYGTMTVLATVYDTAGSSDSEEIDLEWNAVNDDPYWETYPGKDGISTNIAYVGCEWLYNLTEAAVDPDNLDPEDENSADVDFEIDITGNEPAEMNYVTIGEYQYLRWTPVSTGTNSNVIVNAIDGLDDSVIVPQSFSVHAYPNNGACSVIDVGHIDVVDQNTIDVVFTKELDADDSDNFAISTYSISEYLTSANTLGVTATSLIGNNTVELTTATQTADTAYTLTINNVKALDGSESGEVEVGFQGYDIGEITSIEITGITAISNTALDINMNMNIAPGSVSVSDFAINSSIGALGIESATLSTNQRKITLGTTAQSYTNYTLTIRNIESADSSYSVGSEGISGTFMGIPEGGQVIGDCNGDFDVQFNDALMVLGYIVGNYTEYSDSILTNCNLNSDILPDVINTNDAIKVYEAFVANN